MNKKLLIFSGLFIFLLGCETEYRTTMHSQASVFIADSCVKKPNYVMLFFENEKIDFGYKKIALIETSSTINAPDADILNNLKLQAWLRCANGIIQVKKQMLKDKTVFNGIAVQIEQDSIFLKKNKPITDTTFVAKARAYAIKDSEDNKFNPTIGCVAGLLIFVGSIIAGVKKASQ